MSKYNIFLFYVNIMVYKLNTLIQLVKSFRETIKN